MMKTRILTRKELEQFRDYLKGEEKSAFTIEKYLRDLRKFMAYAKGQQMTKELMMEYKKYLTEENYALRSINSMLTAMNSFLRFMGWDDCRVKILKLQREIYCSEEKELTKEEYRRLLNAAEGEERLNLVMQTICGTGIRISELKYFTVEALKRGDVIVRCKNKTRTVFVPKKLVRVLLNYAKKEKIVSGAIFVTRNGKPLDRSNIWTKMKSLCQKAGVKASKVFPHNLRKLFARTFYCLEKDIAKLADILGHRNIETTRIYIVTTGAEHRRKIERLGLIV